MNLPFGGFKGKSESIESIHLNYPVSYGVWTIDYKNLLGPSISAVIFS
jgi:hypothetical protein